jgi:hypothetical protein
MATKEQLKAALKRAYDADDIAAANEIADALEKMDTASKSPPAPEETYAEGVARRFGEAGFAEIAGQYKPEVFRRLAITPEGQGTAVSRIPATMISQAARTGGELALEAGSVVLPDIVKEFASETFEGFSQTGYGRAFGKALSMGLEVYNDLANKYPAEAEQFETNVDVGALFSPRPDLINLDKKALAAKKAGGQTKIDKEKTAVTSMLAPEKLGVGDKTEPVGIGPFKTETWVPNEFEDGVINSVMTIPGIRPYGTIHENFRVMQNHVETQGKTLDNYVKSQNKKIDIEDLNIEFDNALEDFLNSDVYKLASDAAQKQFDKYVSLARDIINSEGNDLKGLLVARRRFDAAIHAAGQTLDADVATYQAKAGKLVRNVMNDYLKRNTKGDTVHQLLDQQFQTLTALDRLVNKRNAEGINALARLKQNIQSGTGVALPTSVLSVIATTSLFYDPAIALGIAAAGAGTLVGQQIARHGKSTVLRSYATLLSATNKAIKTIDDPARLEALELDRMVLIELMDEARQYEEPKEDG